MEKFTFKRLNEDGSATIGNLSLGSISLETPAIFAVLRTTQNPNDLDFLVNCKDQYDLDHVQGGIVRLYNLPKLVIPQVEVMKENEKTPSLDGFKDPFTKFYKSNILMCDPALEYTYFTKAKYDLKFTENIYFCNRLVRFFKEFEKRKKEIKTTDEMPVARLRREMHDELWLGNSRSDRNERNKMVEQLTLYQLSYLPVATPIAPLVTSPEYLKVSLELNDLCQAISYGNRRECTSHVSFHNSMIKNNEVTTSYLEYVRKNKSTKFHSMKFKDLDLHCPVDYKARRGFKKFMMDISSFKQEHNDTAFMMLDAGTQYYVGMQVFDVIGTSLTGFDHDVDGGRREVGEPMTIHWWDENKMWSRPTYDAPQPDPTHCPYCNLTPDFANTEDSVINRRRRGHRLFDLNKDASEYCQQVRAKNIGLHMRRRVANAEFSYASDLILNP
jgi:hypothetical protein